MTIEVQQTIETVQVIDPTRVEVQDTTILEVVEAGAPGPTGPQGPPGAGGSGDDAHFAHVQGVAAATWTVAHGLGKFPAVAVTDSTGETVEGDIDYLDANTVELRFTGALSGTAYFN